MIVWANTLTEFPCDCCHWQTFGDGIDHPLAKRADASLEDTTLEFIKSRLGIDSSAIKFKSGFAGEVSSHAFVKQVHVSEFCFPI